ncbi:hypothetical protein J6590_048537 [Homalodisca vitripennis]|nr:hypothetical protein J6590_048537 [Homalodisca vitripennis]
MSPWNAMYWILAAVCSFLTLAIACSCCCYRQHLKRIAARQAQIRVKLSDLKFDARPFTVEYETRD